MPKPKGLTNLSLPEFWFYIVTIKSDTELKLIHGKSRIEFIHLSGKTPLLHSTWLWMVYVPSEYASKFIPHSRRSLARAGRRPGSVARGPLAGTGRPIRTIGVCFSSDRLFLFLFFSCSRLLLQ